MEPFNVVYTFLSDSGDKIGIELQFYGINEEFKAEKIIINENGDIVEPKFKIWNSLIIEFIYPKLKSDDVKAENIRKIIILFVKMNHLADPSTYYNLVSDKSAENALRPIIPQKNWPTNKEADSAPEDAFEDKESVIAELDYAPILTIGYEDIMELYTERDDSEEVDLKHLESFRLDSRFKFFDSGIWQRYVPVYPYESRKKSFPEILEHVLSRMCSWHEMGLYNTNAGRANLEFQLRMMRNSYIAKVGINGHYEVVTPFKFHSETHFEDKICEHETYLSNHEIKLKWHLLLVDDYAERRISSTPNDTCKLSKKALIEQIIDHKGFEIIIESPFGAETPIEDSGKNIIDACVNKMKGNFFDILLLDYLLGRINPDKINGQPRKNFYKKREYGHDFLMELRNTHEKNAATPKIGPLGKFWICPISSFPFALKDKLWQLGIHAYDDLWRLSDGGDPICTPALFKYNLLSLFKRQVEESYYDAEELEKLFEQLKDISDHKTWAMNLLRALKISQLRQDSLKMDEDGGKGSRFAISIRKAIPIEYEDLTARMIDFLTAFAQWNVFTESWSRLDKLYQNVKKINLGNYEDPILKFFNKIDDFAFKGDQEFLDEINKVKLNRKIDLNCTRMKIERIPDEISQCQSLRSINLSNNKLQILPAQIKELKNLRKLDLSQNQFFDFPAVLGELKDQLNELDLSGNPMDLKISKASTFSEVKKMIEEGLNSTMPGKQTQNIRDYIAAGYIELAIERFRRLVLNDPEYSNEVIQISYRYKTFKREKLGRTEGFGNINVAENQIVSALLACLSDYEKSDIQSLTAPLKSSEDSVQQTNMKWNSTAKVNPRMPRRPPPKR
ncbi:MAG: hypothetical protein ACKV1O_18960 [Saprospiraceae bacterium]